MCPITMERNAKASHSWDGSKQVRVGQLCTPVGTLHISVAYRTKMTISPTAATANATANTANPGAPTAPGVARDNLLMLKSDHFRRDVSPKRQTRHTRTSIDKKMIDLNKPMRPGAFVDVSRIKKYTEQDYLLPEEPAFSWLLAKKDEIHYKKNRSPDINCDYAINDLSENAECQIDSVSNCCNNNNDTCKHNYTQQDKQNQDDKEKSDDDSMERTLSAESMMNSNTENDDNKGSPISRVKRRSRWTLPVEDEKLMKELHFPFATTSSPIGDLARFYRECYHAPPLQIFDAPEMTPIDSINDVTEQLQQFEVSLGEYDSMVNSLCQSGNNNSN